VKAINSKNAIGLVLLAICVGFTVFYYFAYNMSADIAYSNTFGSDIEMIYDAGDFIGQREGLMRVWNTMNSTWRAEDFNTTYSSAMPWDRVKSNTIYYTNIYFNQINRTIDNNIRALNEMLRNNTATGVINNWQLKTLNETVQEMKRGGGLAWAIEGAWYLQFAPMAYYWFAILPPVWIVGVLAALYCFYKGSS